MMKFGSLGLSGLFGLFGLTTALVELSKRQSGVVSVDFNNVNLSYIVPMTIGSSGEIVYVQIDTSVADTWVPSNDVVCAYHQEFRYTHTKNGNTFTGTGINLETATPTLPVTVDQYTTSILAAETCLANGYYDRHLSNSFVTNSSQFQIFYSDRTFAIGTFGNDIVKFDDFEVRLSFATVDLTDAFIGSLGIGFPELEQSQKLYDNLPMALKNQGKISKVLYSLYTNDKKGSLLFGGIDHAKYLGDLQIVPMVSVARNGKNYRATIILSGLNVVKTPEETITIFDSFNLVVLLDTSSAYSYVDNSVLSSILDVLPSSASWDEALELYTISCPADSSGKLEFDFSGAKITVPLIDLTMVKDGICYLTLTRGGRDSPYTIFGTNILQHGYFVFDLQDEEIAIAQAKDTDEQDIEPVISTIPSAIKAPNYSSTELVYLMSLSYTAPSQSTEISYATTQLAENYISQRLRDFNFDSMVSVPKLADDFTLTGVAYFSTMANSSLSSSKFQNSSMKATNLISSTSSSTQSNSSTVTSTKFSSPTSVDASQSTTTRVTASSSNTDNTTSNTSPTSGSSKPYVSLTILLFSLITVSSNLL